jgi:LacI family transcriptional regulator
VCVYAQGQEVTRVDGGATGVLGIIVPDVSSPLLTEIARGVGDAAWAEGYGMVLCETAGDPEREVAALQMLEPPLAEGVVLCDPSLDDTTLIRLLQRHRAAVVFNRPVASEVALCIRVDDAEGMRQTVAHLQALGRHALALLSAAPPSHSSRERERVFGVGVHVTCAPTWEGGYMAARELLATHPQLDALICHNDMVAVGALQACVGMRRHVPNDIAVVGCDDILLARVMTPAITTLHVPKYEIGATAVRMLLERIEGQTGPLETVFTPRLVVRASAPAV